MTAQQTVAALQGTRPEGEDALTVPYVPYGQFNDAWKAVTHVQPACVDTAFLSSISVTGQTAAGVIRALRFLGFVDEAGIPTPSLQAIIARGRLPLEYRARFRAAVLNAYSEVLEDLELESATREELLQRFEGQELSPEVAAKAARFFVGLARHAGIRLSAEIAGIYRSTAGHAAGPLPDSAVHDPGDMTSVVHSREMMPILLDKFPPFDFDWPPERQDRWFELYERLLRVVGITGEREA